MHACDVAIVHFAIKGHRELLVVAARRGGSDLHCYLGSELRCF